MIKTEALLAPDSKVLFSAFLGNGVQLVVLAMCIVVLGILGFYYGHKGNFKTICILMYAFTGLVNGYYSSKYYKYFGGKYWALNIMLSCFMIPLLMFSLWSILNTIAWSYDSTAATPFGAALFIILLCLLIYVPLTLIGGITGRMRTPDSLPGSDNSIPRLYK